MNYDLPRMTADELLDAYELALKMFPYSPSTRVLRDEIMKRMEIKKEMV